MHPTESWRVWRIRAPFYVGVQWHPEDMNGEDSAARLFGAFVEAARRHAEAKRERAGEMSHAGFRPSE